VPAAPPIKYRFGYRSRTRTLTLNPNLKPNPSPTRTLKVTKMYTVQNDTGIKFSIELYSYFPRDGGAFIKGLSYGVRGAPKGFQLYSAFNNGLS